MDLQKAIYTTTVDGGVELISECKFNPENNVVSDVGVVEANFDVIEGEYIETLNQYGDEIILQRYFPGITEESFDSDLHFIHEDDFEEFKANN